MICGSVLWRARPTLASALLLVAASILAPIPAARSQDRTTQDRLDRLERDLTMLQRQVYRGPSQIVATGSGAVDSELRMERLESQMRELTGRVEDAVNGVELLRRRLEQINGDIEVRLSQGQGQPKGASSSQASAGLTDTSPAAPADRRNFAPIANPRGTLVPPTRDPPTGIGSLTPPALPPGPGTDGANVAIAGAPRPPPGGAGPGGSALEQYNHAYGLLKQANYPAAENAFKTFIKQYPDDPRAGTAQYWLGETFYEQRKFSEAASAFAEGYKRYPKGTKAADDLLKLGMSLARANQKQNACVALAQLDRDFPNPGSAIKELSSKEKKQLGC
jgi:tol-pal system protein YbgF